ncbi:unnamed protein product [Symbiodinium natans]|uniref:C2H2-type domain-containing protein n=1 Tax=Symbiodinium natans TaxID=878477 RepID=A0A812I7F4_9DINO|nr:unnamed protein product [Symbiodinium natans]
MPSLSQLAKGYEHPDVLPAPCAQAVLDDVTSIATPKAKAATRVCFLSANLCTLGDKKPALLCQAEAQSIHVLAFQETRSRCAWQSHGRWFQFHSAAQAGQGGCSVLLDSQALRLKKEDCVTVEARADLLCVHVKSTAFHGTIISFHAPHSLKPEEEIRGWWQRFDAFVSSVQSKGPMVWLGDANARLGAGHSMCHGSYGAEASNLAGEQFASVAEKYSCVIANTHAEIMHGVDHRTWRDRRLDYIVLPPAWVAGAFAHPPSCFDLLNPHDDHRPVIISCCVPAASAKQASQRVGRYQDRKLVPAGRPRDDPRPRATPKPPARPYVSATTAAMLQFRKELFGRHRQAKLRTQLDFLSFPFRAWASMRSTSQPPHGQVIARRLHLVAVLEHGIGRTIYQIRAAIRRDKAHYIQQQVKQLRQHADARDFSQLYRSLRCFRTGGRKVMKPFSVLLTLKDSGGELVFDFEAAQAIKADHFGRMEAAVPSTADELAAHDQAQCQLHDSAGDPFDLLQLPSLLQIEKHVRQLPAHKAPGPSGVPNEIWTCAPARAARCWYGPVLKMHVRLTEPFRMSSGLLVALFKQKGSPHLVSNYRSILLLEGIGKASRKSLRGPILQCLAQQAPPLFAGCLPKSNLQMLTHYAQTLVKCAKAKGHACALHFIDVQSAYYAVYRQHLTEREVDHSICSILSAMGVDPDTIHLVRSWASGSPLLADIDPHQLRMLRALFRCPAFVLATRELNAACTAKAFCKALVLSFSVSPFGQMTYLYQSGPRRQLTLKPSLWQPAATSTLCTHGELCASTTREARLRSSLLLTAKDLVRSSVVCLGALARAKHAVVPLAQPVLRNTDVPEHVRRLVLSSLGLSVALHNVGIWTSLPDNAMNAWMNGIGDLYRLLAPEDRHTHHPDCPDVRSVAGRCGLPYPATLLTEQRLLHFMRIVVQERVELWDLLMVEFSCSCYSWLHLVLQDIAFLRYWQPRVLTADCWDRLVQSPVELMVWVSDHSRVFRRLIARAIDAQSKSLRHWYLRQKEVRVAAAQRSPAVTSESCEARTCDLCVSCPDCPLTFGSVNALAAHQALQHGAIKLARQITMPGHHRGLQASAGRMHSITATNWRHPRRQG